MPHQSLHIEKEPLPEKELLQQIARGSGEAFREIYDRYHHALYRNVMRLLHASEEAEDVVQEVFITLWEKRTELHMDRSIDGWLFTLSYHRTINYLKRKLRHLAPLEAVGEPEDPGMVPDETEAQWQILQQAIDRLSPQKKKVFELCKLRGQSYEKTAQELGLSRYTVGEYLREAMASVREYIQQQPLQGASVVTLLLLEIFLR